MDETQYTAVATAIGEGRSGGRTGTDDGVLDLLMAVPKELGGQGKGTNPEQLVAAGWATCFLGATKIVAGQWKLRLTNLAVVAEVTLHHDADDYWLSAVLRVEASGVGHWILEELGRTAHQICPYSKATRGNIDVRIEAAIV